MADAAGSAGQGGLLLVACGALARELVDIQRQFPDGVVEITCLPASWHNHPERIVPGVRRKVDAALRDQRSVAVVYGDCGTGGELDAYLDQVGVPRIPGPHCYEMFLGKPVFDDEMEHTLGTFFLTDYMVRHFERIVMQGMGLRKHPQLRDMYFGHYTRVLYIAQTDVRHCASKRNERRRNWDWPMNIAWQAMVPFRALLNRRLPVRETHPLRPLNR